MDFHITFWNSKALPPEHSLLQCVTVEFAPLTRVSTPSVFFRTCVWLCVQRMKWTNSWADLNYFYRILWRCSSFCHSISSKTSCRLFNDVRCKLLAFSNSAVSILHLSRCSCDSFSSWETFKLCKYKHGNKNSRYAEYARCSRCSWNQRQFLCNGCIMACLAVLQHAAIRT